MASEVPTFCTNDLYLAAWLLCRRTAYRQHGLNYLGVGSRPTPHSGKPFLFSDPDNEGPALQREFRRNPIVRLHSLRNALNFLRDQVNSDDASGGVR